MSVITGLSLELPVEDCPLNVLSVYVSLSFVAVSGG